MLDFMKVDQSKNRKKNTLVMMDSFSKFSVTVIKPNQKAKMVVRALVDKWFHSYGIPALFHSNQGKSFDNHIIEELCKLSGIQQYTTTPYYPCRNCPCPCESFNHTLQNLLKTLSSRGLRKAKPQGVTFCSKCLGKPFSVR